MRIEKSSIGQKRNEPLLVEIHDSPTAWLDYVNLAEERLGQLLKAAVDPSAPQIYRLASPSYTAAQNAKEAEARYDVKNRTQHFELARKGWKEGAAQLEQAEKAVFNNISAFLKDHSVSLDVSGSAFDIGLLIDEVPEHWMYMKQEESTDVRIVFSPEVMWNTSKDAAAVRGAAIIALVRALEDQGRRVELWLGFDNTSDYNGQRLHYETRILFKRQQDYVSLVDLAFPCCHTGFLGSLEFSNIEWHWGLGGDPPAVAPGSHAFNAGVRMEGDVVISGSNEDNKYWTDPQVCADWIIGKLKKLGVELV